MTKFPTLSCHLTKSLPRLLTQLCRDKDSPLYGCFDRNFWHYKIRDFPSMVLQQAVCVLDMISHGKLPLTNDLKINKEITNQWVEACLNFWTKSQRSNGSFDEYYPYESGFPPTAFSLYSTALVCKNRKFDKSILFSMERAAEFILLKPELQAINQEIVGLTACSIVKSLGGNIDDRRLSKRWDNLFLSQNSEGWFNEYDGADTGYLSVSCDALFDYFEIENDERALRAITQATDYIFHMLAVDDSIPAMINSRNTDYILPYGLSRISNTNEQASSIIIRLIRGIEKPTHYLHSVDDRYLTHYIYTSWYRCLPHIKHITESPPIISKGKWFQNAGILALHNQNSSSIHIAAGKGGIVVKTKNDGSITKDLGWRCKIKKNLYSCTHWQEPESIYSLVQKDSLFTVNLEMPLKKHRFLVPGPVLHITLRILSRIFGNKIIPLLKNMIIFRSSKLDGLYKRKIFIEGSEIKIFDSFYRLSHLTWEKADWQSLRHVSSAGSYCKSEAQNIDAFELDIETAN
jgi:hypothetical protein